MDKSALLSTDWGDDRLEVLWGDAERIFCRLPGSGADSERYAFMPTLSDGGHPALESINHLAHECELREYLDAEWSLRPVDLLRERGRTMLVVDYAGGEPLDRLIGPPMEIGRLLRLAVALAGALSRLHGCGLIHKDVRPANVIVNSATGQTWLTGFGFASRLPRERQAPEPPETIAGTLAYMAPEQTGRMNRSIDVRSDLYALGVTLYEMLTGSLPFSARDPMEWVHCHVARRAMPPVDRVKHVPPTVSAIVMKLLAKTAEERYQTAAGLERDLRRCLAQFENEARIDDFALGERDTPDRLLIPEKLYGRQREVETLVAAFDRVVQGGAPELVLVSGYSGIGKSAVVNEVHKVLIPPRGLFAAGKFDQYKRDIPYYTLAQALQSLVRPLLAKGDDELGGWRESLREALGPNGQLMVDLVPELKLIVGEQSPVPELPPQHARRRFQLMFRRILSVFARPEHPLALFFDDLQWLDAATLEVLEDLLTHPDVRHVLLIGAYRDNEVSPTHALMRALDRIRAAGASVHDIVLAPLALEHLGQLISDSLYRDLESVAPLAELVHRKTAGNPFFVIQFISELFEKGLLTFDHGAARWAWDLARIHAMGYTDNVIDLMVGKLTRLPVNTQKALQQLACLGNSAQFALLAMGREDSMENLHGDLLEALRAGLILSSEGSYRFLHDRIQEAAYSRIPDAERAQTHLRIGRLLVARTPSENRDEAIFEIVNQLNRGHHLITSMAERERVAELNFIAGRRAKSSTAYGSALKYLHAARGLSTDETWKRNRDLVFEIEYLLAECELLTTGTAAAENRLARLAERATSAHEIALLTRLRVTLYTASDRSDRAVEVFLQYWKDRGTAWSAHPTDEEVLREYGRIWSLLGSRQIGDLVDLPLTTDPDVLDVLDVLHEVVAPALYTDQGFLALALCRMVCLSLEHGNCDASCFAYVWLGMIAGPRFGNYRAGFEFGKLGYDLVEERGLRRYQARTYMEFGTVITPWTRHIKTGRELQRRCFDAANRTGDFTYAAYSRNNLNTNLLAAGDPLPEVQREAEIGLEFASSIRLGVIIDVISAQRALVRTLRGLTVRFGSFDEEGFDETEFERHLAGNPALVIAECWYWVRKVQARFLAGDYLSAIEASANAQRLLWTSAGFFETAEYHFYSALARAAAALDCAKGDSRQRHLEALAVHQKQQEVWAQHCPENFENRRLLIEAEIASIEERELDAERLYEAAIRSARKNGFVQNEALAYERAARSYLGRGFEDIGIVYLRKARRCYLLWGADGKVRQLEQLYPFLRMEETASAATGSIGALVEQLDLSTVIKVSQAVSGEIVLDKLLDTVMRTALEQAGAQRALLMLSREAEQRIVAEAATSNDTIVVQLRDEPVTASTLPETIFRYVLHTHESVILDDAAILNPFSTDPYIGQQQARSVLCLPVTNQAKLIGVLYLENNLAPSVFVPARIAVLKLLASQAAISLENTRLYRDLAEREARIRRLVEANIIGIFIWELDGRILDANDAFLTMAGYDRQDLAARGLRWTDMTPPEWHDRDERLMLELKPSGTLQPFEKEYFRKDGSRVPVLVGVASFDATGNQGVAYVVDLTERKRAQEALNRASAELAHVSRVTALSALTASIAHEVNQPLSGIITNAGTCLRMLDASPPNIDGARETARRTIRDGNRASEVIARLRALFSKREFTLESLDVNEVAREVIALSSNDLQRNRIILQVELADDLPIVTGDRIQLQQVVLNLLRNASDAMADVHDRQRQALVKTEREAGGRVRLSVRDAGVGLSPQSLDSLFDPFYTTKSGGMGIGLFVSRSIVERHQGRLWGEPNHDGPGATFAFSIPNAQHR